MSRSKALKGGEGVDVDLGKAQLGDPVKVQLAGILFTSITNPRLLDQA